MSTLESFARLAPLLFLAAACAGVPDVAAPPASADPASAAASEAIRSGPVVRGELGRQLDAYLTSLETFGMHGAILVAKDGEVVLKQGYGIADHGTGRAITERTVFHLGSLSKQFTAAAVMTLAMAGKLSVADPIAAYLEDVPPDKQAVTIHHLLTHTSGLPYMPGAGSPLELPLASAPGERWSYSNPGYSLLAELVEAVSGQDFHAYLRAHVFAPAGLDETFAVGIEPPVGSDFARAYTDETDQGLVTEFTASEPFRGAGDYASSLDDLYRWERALREHLVLDEDATRQVFTEHARNPGSPTGYGYGWMMGTTPRGTRLVHHGGNLGGFNTDYRRYLDEGLTIVFLSNHFVNGRSMRDAVMNNVSMLVNGGTPQVPPALAPLSPERAAQLDRFAGRYALDTGGELEVAAAGSLLALSTEQPELAGALFDPQLDDGVRAFLDDCLANSLRVVDGLLSGDPEPLRAHISASLPFDSAWPGLQRYFAELQAELGPPATLVPVCAVPTGGARSGKAFVRLTGATGSRLIQLTWSGGILHCAEREAVVPQYFAAERDRDGGFAAYNLFTGTTVRVEFTARDGTMELTLHTANGAVTATRGT